MALVRSILVVIVTLNSAWSWADNPLTSTRFWQAQMEIEPDPSVHALIESVREDLILTPEMMNFLADPKTLHGSRMALINAAFHLGNSYDENVSPNAALFTQFLEHKYGRKITLTDSFGEHEESLSWRIVFGHLSAIYPDYLSAGELLSLGYLWATNWYHSPTIGLHFALGAMAKDPSSLAARVLVGLILGNLMFNGTEMAHSLDESAAELLLNMTPEQLRELRAQASRQISHELRMGHVYELFAPLVTARFQYRQDFAPAALQVVMEYIQWYKPDADAWRKSQEQLRTTMESLKLDCSQMLEPKIRTVQ